MTPELPSPAGPPRPWRPWRSATAGWLVTAVLLVAGVPLFLGMPPWCDVTLYQLAARNVLAGGVHYRDVFDTNLPGFVWAMAALWVVFGDDLVGLRAVDLLVIGGAVWALYGFARAGGGTPASVAWFVTAAALFYPLSTEFCHLQRDPWMLLPAALAARLRRRRVGEERSPPPTPSLKGRGEGSEGNSAGEARASSADASASEASSLPPFREGGRVGGLSSFLEGFLWGAAVWVKPHVFVPALMVWAVSAVFLARQEGARAVWRDLAALVGGGLVAGGVGVGWLVATGAWGPFLEVFLEWNPGYVANLGPLHERGGYAFVAHRPWGLLHYPALVLAFLALWEARLWSRATGKPAPVPGAGRYAPYVPAESGRAVGARSLLAALYLGWMAQAVVIQKELEYVHLPPVLLALALLASQRWCPAVPYLGWFALAGALANGADAGLFDRHAVQALDPGRAHLKFERHPLADPRALGDWPRVFAEGSTPAVRDRLAQYKHAHCATGWVELAAAADWLRDPANVWPPLGDGELNGWHDSTHPLYLMLEVRPATRYIHYGTAFAITDTRPLRPGAAGDVPKREQIARAVRESRQRYVVSDLCRTTWEWDA
ncbi:MAG: hypothetical protein K2V38_16735, partial [Gemmataceae bacterium]|nr:hypothetical protein [Gemmataceae bacterium]